VAYGTIAFALIINVRIENKPIKKPE